MNTKWVAGTVHKSGLSPSAFNLVQKNDSRSLAKEGRGPGNCTCGDQFTEWRRLRTQKYSFEVFLQHNKDVGANEWVVRKQEYKTYVSGHTSSWQSQSLELPGAILNPSAHSGKVSDYLVLEELTSYPGSPCSFSFCRSLGTRLGTTSWSHTMFSVHAMVHKAHSVIILWQWVANVGSKVGSRLTCYVCI